MAVTPGARFGQGGVFQLSSPLFQRSSSGQRHVRKGAFILSGSKIHCSRAFHVLTSRAHVSSSKAMHSPTTTNRRSFKTASFASNAKGGKEQKDYYATLGVSKTATQEEIKKAYHKLAMKNHPDLNKNDKDASARFAEINNAYEILKDPEKRKKYDDFGPMAFDPNYGGGPDGFEGGFPGGFPGGAGFPGNMEDILRGFGFTFGNDEGGGGGGGRRGRRGGGGDEMDEEDLEDIMGGVRSERRGRDVELNMNLTLLEAVMGVEKQVSFSGNVTCKSCKGSGAAPNSKVNQCKSCKGTGQESRAQGMFVFSSTCRACGGQGSVISNPCTSCSGKGVTREKRTVLVKVPAGIDSGQTVRVAGQGEQSKSGKSGNLFVHINVEPHELFRREELDVHVDIPISVSQAILGGKVKVPTLRDGEIEIDVPAGTQPETVQKLSRKGIKSLSGSQMGHQFVHFKVCIPTSLSSAQRKLVEEFGKEEQEASHPAKRSFFRKVNDFLKAKK